MPTKQQILSELEEKSIVKKFKIKTSYSKFKEDEVFSPDQEKIKRYVNNFNTQNGTALTNHRN